MRTSFTTVTDCVSLGATFGACARSEAAPPPAPIARIAPVASTPEVEPPGAVAVGVHIRVDSPERSEWRALYARLEKLESELTEHVHLENNVQFPRALNAE